MSDDKDPRPENLQAILVDSDFLVSIWATLEAVLRKAFADADFRNEYADGKIDAVDGPIDWTRSGISGGLGRNFKHVLVFDAAKNILGGILCIPASRNEGETCCEVGWFFVLPEIARDLRRLVAMEMDKQMRSWLRGLGFEKIVVDIGTKAGEKYLSRNYGFTHSPLPENQNRWVREL
ncbi:MAG: hypothetical protein K2Q25_15565 [Mycobacteriaceae bacterium]|nr:hypothetical protein [Mycobacteriaceae bacterium]